MNRKRVAKSVLSVRERMAVAVALSATACGGPAAGPTSPGPGGGEPCTEAGTGYAHALLRVGCDGELVPGRANWSSEANAITLTFGAAGEGAGPVGAVEGPVGAELVSAWPPLGDPPWLGHRVESITVLSSGRVRVHFGEPHDEPARIFADRRLSGVPVALAEGDARDAIDTAQGPVLTRHDDSIEYARSLGRNVERVQFEQLYLVAFAGRAGAADARELGRSVGADWVGWGAAGARRLTSSDWGAMGARCGPVSRATEAALLGRAAPVDPTISHAAGDGPGRQIAERLVSLAMRTDGDGAIVRSLAGTGAGTEARLAVRAAETGHTARTASDVGTVMRVTTGPGHPCSLYAEALRMVADWAPGHGGDNTNVILIGETAVFEIPAAGSPLP